MKDTVIYLGRDNRLQGRAKENASWANWTQVTKLIVELRSRTLGTLAATYDSVAHPTVVWFDAAANFDCDLAAASPAPSKGNYLARIITFDPSNANGLVWGDVPVSIR